MEGAPGTLYEGEKFQLLFKFSSRYPFDSPQVRRTSSAATVSVCLVFMWVNVRRLCKCSSFTVSHLLTRNAQVSTILLDFLTNYLVVLCDS